MNITITHAALVVVATGAATALTYYASSGNAEYTGIAGAVAAGIVAALHMNAATPPAAQSATPVSESSQA